LSEVLWSKVDDYLTERLHATDAALEHALRESDRAGLPPIAVSPPQGRFLTLLARLIAPARVLELGTLGGYSAICLARGLRPGGRLTTLEFSPENARVAKANIAHAGLADRVDVIVGAALDTLPGVEKSGAGPFDLVFIDADKAHYDAYWEWALRLSRPEGGTVIIADNVVRDGEVINAESTDPRVRAVRVLMDLMHKEPRAASTALQTVGGKGYDGFAMAIIGPK